MNPTEPSEEVKQIANQIMLASKTCMFISSHKQFEISKDAAKWHLAEVAAMKLRIDRYKANLTIASLQHAEWEIEQINKGTK